MYSLLARPLMRRAYQQVCAGRPTIVERLAAQDVVFVFPGTSSFGGTWRGKEELLGWMRRFAELRPRITVHEVAVSGPPWDLKVAVRLDDTFADYRNEVMELLWIKWGRLRRLEVFLDTERLSAWERRRAARAQPNQLR